jgi:hypothetical protein
LHELESGRSLSINPNYPYAEKFTFDWLSGGYSKRRLRVTQFTEGFMAKKPLTVTQINSQLKFRPGWIKDPAPVFRRLLDRESLKQVSQAKAAFVKQINTIVKNRQG